jgi:pilus assembly protein Flp/PilA
MENIMKNVYLALKQLLAEENGQDLVEYALVTALVGLVAVTALNSLALAITTAIGKITAALNAVPGGAAS